MEIFHCVFHEYHLLFESNFCYLTNETYIEFSQMRHLFLQNNRTNQIIYYE